jgi:hypothetical protein
VRFGPEGVEGRLASGPFRSLEDALFSTPGGHTLPVRLGPDGSFRGGGEDESRADAVLVSDRQRARQALYDKLLVEPQPGYVADRSLLLAWAEPVDMHFTLAPQARRVGAALLAVPLRFERTPPGTRVLIPGAFVDCRRITSDGRPIPPGMSGRSATTMRLRFQVPPSVLPLEVEGARFSVKLNAPAREVALGAYAGGDAVPLRRLSNPVGVERVEIDDPRLLRPDGHGALYLNVVVGEAHGPNAEWNVWRVESPALEVHGRTAAEGKEGDRPRGGR